MTVETALLAAFTDRLGPLRLVAHSRRSWHSATFGGWRHTFEVALDVPVDVDRCASEIAEQDIAIPGGFVADVAVVCDQARYASAATGNLKIEVLTIDA